MVGLETKNQAVDEIEKNDAAHVFQPFILINIAGRIVAFKSRLNHTPISFEM